MTFPRKMRLGTNRPPTILPGSRWLVARSLVARSTRNAERHIPRDNGHWLQRSFFFLHTSEPKSMRAACHCAALELDGSGLGGTSKAILNTSPAFSPAFFIFTPNTLRKILSMFTSMHGVGIPKAKFLIATAVYGPTPGIERRSNISRGKPPLSFVRDSTVSPCCCSPFPATQ